jgi:hypothetical protein
MASFSFDDGTGTQTLSCGWPSPANRLQNWIPQPKYVGGRAVAVGDRRRYQYVLGTSQAASGELTGIAVADEAILRAFKLWAEGGGLFTVTTNDAESNVYADCQLASDPDSDELIDLAISLDRKRGVFTVGFVIEHVGSPQQVLRMASLSSPSTVLNITAAQVQYSAQDWGFVFQSLDIDAGAVEYTAADWDLAIA